MKDPDLRHAALREYAAGAIMAVGGLIAGLSGLCTLYFAVRFHPFVLPRGDYASGLMFSGLIAMLLTGGIPISLGVVIFRFGLRLFRTSSRPPADTSD